MRNHELICLGKERRLCGPKPAGIAEKPPWCGSRAVYDTSLYCRLWWQYENRDADSHLHSSRRHLCWNTACDGLRYKSERGALLYKRWQYADDIFAPVRQSHHSLSEPDVQRHSRRAGLECQLRGDRRLHHYCFGFGSHCIRYRPGKRFNSRWNFRHRHRNQLH